MTALKKVADSENSLMNSNVFWEQLGLSYPQAVFEVDFNFNLIHFNPIFLSMLGAKDDNIKGNHWFNYIRNNEKDKIKDIISYVLHQKSQRTARLLFIHSKGEIVWTNSQFLPAVDRFGNPTVLVFIMDQTYQHHLHEKLNILSSQIEHLNQENYVGAFQYHLETGQAVFDNFWITMNLGFKLSDLRIQNDGLKAILSKDTYEEFILWLRSSKAKGTPNLKVYFIDADGQQKATLCGAKKVISAGIEIVHVWCKDVSKNENLENRVKELEVSDLHSNKLAFLGEMTSEITHELGNNIMSISLSLDLLNMKKMKAQSSIHDYEKTIDVVQRSIGRMQKLIMGVKHLSYTDNTHEFVDASVSDIIDELQMIFNNVIHKEGYEFEIIYNTVKTKTIYCEQTHLIQGVMNLIKNSVDAISEHDEKWIKVELKEDSSCFQFIVSDSGPGISKEFKDKIFKQYFTTKGKGKGTGIGLSVAGKVADIHSGRFFLDDSKPQTTFVIEIPKSISNSKKYDDKLK